MVVAVPQKRALLSGSFSGTGQSSSVLIEGRANLTMGGSATVKVEKSYDEAATWFDVSADSIGTLASYVMSSSEVSVVIDEPESGVLYRLNCTAYTSATTYRISQ